MLNDSINMTSSMVIKVLAITSFIFLILALYIIGITPTINGYELSIYDEYPIFFWIFVIISLICSIFILVYQSFFLEEKSKFWFIGVLIFMFVNIIIILLPLFRNYFLFSSFDEVVHLGFIKDIYLTGYLGKSNFYPHSHILAYMISSISGININTTIKIISTFFYILYIAGLYLLARTIGNFKQTVLIMGFGSVLLFTYFNYLFLPTQFLLYFIPLILTLLMKRILSKKVLEYTIVFLILLAAMPFLHPLGSIFLISILLIFQISTILYNFILRKGWIMKGSLKSIKTTGPSIFLFIIFFMWFSAFAIFKNTISKALNWFLEGSGSPAVETISQKIVAANFSVLDFINLLMYRYGPSLIFSLLTFLSILIILRKFKVKKEIKIEEIFFSILFLSFAVFYIQTLFGDFIITGESLRIYCWALAIATLLNGLILREWIGSLNINYFRIFTGLITSILIITAILGVYSVFPSPYMKQANPMVTNVEPSGMEWFFTNKDSGSTNYISSFPFTARYLIYGFDSPKPKNMKLTRMIPHFGYDFNDTADKSFKNDSYLVLTSFDREFYMRLWPTEGKFNQNDFFKLNSDHSVNKIYMNGELDIWKVKITN